MIFVLLLLAFSVQAVRAELPVKPDFNQHIRPILAENCFKCHGSDEKQRKGKLRLDVREDAVEKKAIVSGKPDESELIKRILTTDEEDVMPPTKEHRTLTADQKALLRRWIAEGADYKKHWAFIPPVKAALPPSALPPIDAFIQAKLDEQKITPAASAPKDAWLRRVSFAMTGLPPRTAELDAFIADESPQAREHVVDRLLSSSAYGEHLARDWMDAARYADSYGRHEDGDMVMWPYREWIIRAFNENLPYDQFITWQTAGDLLPKPTRDQLVATAFNRLALQSNESGNDPEEFRLDQVSDRVRANGLAFMGLTVECAKCHDHKYDPISQRNYWQMAAFFDNIDENGVYSQFCPQAIPSPSLMLPTPAQQTALDAVHQKISTQEKAMSELRKAAQTEYNQWIKSNGVPGEPAAGFWNSLLGMFGGAYTNPWEPHALGQFDFTQNKDRVVTNKAATSKPGKMRTGLEVIKGVKKDAVLMKGDDEVTFPEMGDFRQFDAFSFAIWLQPREKRDRSVVLSRSRGGNDDGRGYEVVMDHEVPSFALMHFQPGNEIRIRSKKPLALNAWTHLTVTYDGSSRAGGMKMYLNGVVADVELVHDHLTQDITRRAEWGDIDLNQIRFNLGGREHDSPLKNCGIDEFWIFGRTLSAGEVKHLVKKEATAEDWYDWWLQEQHEPWKKASAELRKLREEETGITNNVLEMMVMQEQSKRRPCYVRTRGDYRQRAEEVQPGVLQSVLPFNEQLPRNRLGLAQWLVSRDHPLTSRVVVNRVWQMFFSRGLVATPQDFGTRGEQPSHPELLDWLAVDFVEHGWDVKRLCRMIALSDAFGRSSSISASPSSMALDPDNKFLSRGPRQRLIGEEIRDQALLASGLLNPKIGGPSAHPYLPDTLYNEGGLQQHYIQDEDDGQYRRSMYSFWRRTLPPPELAVFDAPSREFCVLKREKTNTPMQALVLLNNPQYLEMQRVMAQNLVGSNADDKTRCATAFRALTSRQPTEAETGVLLSILQRERAYFKDHADEAGKLLTSSGPAPQNPALPVPEVAAMAITLRSLMSHDECMSR